MKTEKEIRERIDEEGRNFKKLNNTPMWSPLRDLRKKICADRVSVLLWVLGENVRV